MSDPNRTPGQEPDETSPDDPTVQPDGTPVENPSGSDERAAKHRDGNTDAGSDSDVASGGAPD